MALGMMPCSSSAVAASKPVPMVYVFPAPVCVPKMQGGVSQHPQCHDLPTCVPCPILVPKPHPVAVTLADRQQRCGIPG